MLGKFVAYLCAIVALCLVLAGCGGSNSSETFKSLKVEPATVRLTLGGINAFTALLDGTAQSVKWTVVDANGGTISGSGAYTAPQKSGTYTVKVELASDPTKSATATVIVESNYAVTVTPATGVKVGTDGMLNFSATVSGASTQAVTWATTGGTISATGVLTAPSTTGPITVTATSVADPAKSKTVNVDVVLPVAIVSPAPVPLALVRSTLNFTAQVNGVDSTAITWTTTSGTISSTGVLTAPDSSGTVTVRATSTADSTKYATVDVNVADNVNVRLKIQGKEDVLFSLRPDKAPNHCANFVSLVNKKFYDGIKFHRYVADFVIQGGDPLTKTLPIDDPSIGTGGPGYTIPFEANDLLHDQYVLAMARSTGLDTAGSQFYVTLQPRPDLDGSYVVFGKVLAGFAVIDALRVGDLIVSATTEPVTAP